MNSCNSFDKSHDALPAEFRILGRRTQMQIQFISPKRLHSFA